MGLTAKQKEYITSATHRWNVKTGATRSGKTWLDLNFIIPSRIRAVSGRPGLIILAGHTKGTLQRNIIEPMQEIWGTSLVSDIGSDNKATLFGESAFCLGADKITSVNKFRGLSCKYLYGDEAATWNEAVFELIKSRLDKPYSKADLTCNPDLPTHFFKEFIDSDVDKFVQEYTLFDNPYLDQFFVDQLCKEYAGTVYYDRYIMGLWRRADGLCFPSFKERNILDRPPEGIQFVNIGADIGGSGSATVYTAVGFFRPKGQQRLGMVVLDELYDKDNYSTESILNNFKAFVSRVRSRWTVADCYSDSAEQLILKSMRNLGIVNVHNSLKMPIVDRIRFWDMMYASERAFIVKDCTHAIDAVQSAVWDDKAQKETRLDDGTSNIDSLDSMEYAVERMTRDLI